MIAKPTERSRCPKLSFSAHKSFVTTPKKVGLSEARQTLIDTETELQKFLNKKCQIQKSAILTFLSVASPFEMFELLSSLPLSELILAPTEHNRDN